MRIPEETHRSKSFYPLEAIKRGLPHIEWEYDLAQRAADVRGGRVVTEALDYVMREDR